MRGREVFDGVQIRSRNVILDEAAKATIVSFPDVVGVVSGGDIGARKATI
jgi:hypothetical protein